MTILGYQNEDNDDENDLPIELPLLDSEICNILISLPQPDIENVTFQESKELEIQTRGQNTSQIWHQRRKNIFTSSIFGKFESEYLSILLTFLFNFQEYYLNE